MNHLFPYNSFFYQLAYVIIMCEYMNFYQALTIVAALLLHLNHPDQSFTMIDNYYWSSPPQILHFGAIEVVNHASQGLAIEVTNHASQGLTSSYSLLISMSLYMSKELLLAMIPVMFQTTNAIIVCRVEMCMLSNYLNIYESPKDCWMPSKNPQTYPMI